MPATYEPIATTTLGSAAASITFSSIASSWTDLKVILTTAGASSANAVIMRFNSDTGTNYGRTSLIGNGTTASSTRQTSATSLSIGGSALDGTNPSLYEIDVFSYAGSTYKTMLSAFSSDRNGTGFVSRMVGLWLSTAAITTIDLTNNGGTFAIGTTATLYGIKNA